MFEISVFFFFTGKPLFQCTVPYSVIYISSFSYPESFPAWFGRLLQQKRSCAQEYIIKCCNLLLLNSFLSHIENQKNETALTLQCNSPLAALTDSPLMISGKKKITRRAQTRARLSGFALSSEWPQQCENKKWTASHSVTGHSGLCHPSDAPHITWPL